MKKKAKNTNINNQTTSINFIALLENKNIIQKIFKSLIIVIFIILDLFKFSSNQEICKNKNLFLYNKIDDYYIKSNNNIKDACICPTNFFIDNTENCISNTNKNIIIFYFL